MQFPNVLGFLFGIAQMILYLVYKDSNNNDDLKLKITSMEMNSSSVTGDNPNKVHSYDHRRRKSMEEKVFVQQEIV